MGEREASLLRAVIGRSPLATPTSSDLQEWVSLARSERMLPALHALVTGHDGDLTADQIGGVWGAQRDVMGVAVRIEHELLEVSAVLGSSGIDHVVLKGVATAHLDHLDPSLRQFGDVDLLVAPASFAAACDALTSAGWTQSYVVPRHHERFTHALTFRRTGGYAEVDLHQRIAHRALGRLVPTERLLVDAETFDIDGFLLSALSARHRLIHAALHASASRGRYRRLSSVADVLVLASALAGSADAVLEQSGEWRVRTLVERSVRDAHDAAGLPVPTVWLTAMESSPRRRRSLVDRAYATSTRRPLAEELAHLALLDGWRDRGRYLTGYFATDPGYAERKRRVGVVAQSRYLWSRIRSGRSE